jgi:hypothetical protein
MMMHILTALALTVGASLVLVGGLIRVLQDLLERGPYDAPLVEPLAEESAGENPWRAEREAGGSWR